MRANDFYNAGKKLLERMTEGFRTRLLPQFEQNDFFNEDGTVRTVPIVRNLHDLYSTKEGENVLVNDQEMEYLGIGNMKSIPSANLRSTHFFKDGSGMYLFKVGLRSPHVLNKIGGFA